MYFQIPGRWQVFIDQLKSSALEDCAAFYESDINMLLQKYENSQCRCFLYLLYTCSYYDFIFEQVLLMKQSCWYVFTYMYNKEHDILYNNKKIYVVSCLVLTWRLGTSHLWTRLQLYSSNCSLGQCIKVAFCIVNVYCLFFRVLTFSSFAFNIFFVCPDQFGGCYLWGCGWPQ